MNNHFGFSLTMPVPQKSGLPQVLTEFDLELCFACPFMFWCPTSPAMLKTEMYLSMVVVP